MANCTNGLYVSPKMGSTLDSLSKPLEITWDSSCLSCQEIDIYLYAPNSALPRIHVWEHVALSRGTYSAQLMPRWWNATQSQQLQIIIVPTGDPPFMSTFPAGPVFTATYAANSSSSTPAAADTSIIDSGVTRVNDVATQQASKKAVSGRAAAGVLIPLLFIALAVFAYIKLKRRKEHQKRQAWTEKVDQRMSTISTEWKSVSAAGAQAAIRNSMAVASRNSSLSFSAMRPISHHDPDDPSANEKRNPAMRSGTGIGLRNPNALSSAASPRNSTTSTRVSRVSFAPDTRASRVSLAESTDSSSLNRKNVASRAFHSAYVPPVPALPEGISSVYFPDKDKDGLSPRQTAGALTLTQDEIKARIGAVASGRPNKGSVSALDDEMLPALSMMRTGNMEFSGTDDFLLPPTAPLQLPEPSYSPTTPSITASFPVPPKTAGVPPSVVLSPDEMLRAYAERKKSLADAARAGRIGAPLRASVVPSIAASALSSPSTTTSGNSLHSTGSLGMGMGKVETVSSIHATGMRVAYNNTDSDGLAFPPPPSSSSGYHHHHHHHQQTKPILPLSFSSKGSKGIESGKALLGKVKSIGKKRKSMNPFAKFEPEPEASSIEEQHEAGFENPGEAYVAALEADAAQLDLGDDVVGAYPYAYDQQQQQQQEQQQYYGQYYGYQYGEQQGAYENNENGGEEGLSQVGQAYGY